MFTVVREHRDLVKYCRDLQAKNSDSLGFLPSRAFEEGASARQIFLGLLNGEPAGYIFAGSGYRGVLRRWQVCMEYDARRRLYGSMLVDSVEKYGEAKGCTRSVVVCANDLEANDFWKSLGYELIGTQPAGDARRYKRSHLNVLAKSLNPEIVATYWKNGRPRVHADNAARQKAYRERRALQNSPGGRLSF